MGPYSICKACVNEVLGSPCPQSKKSEGWRQDDIYWASGLQVDAILELCHLWRHADNPCNIAILSDDPLKEKSAEFRVLRGSQGS